MNYTTDVFTRFDKRWALVTAGTISDFNCLTVSWGQMGTLWSTPVVTVFVKQNRWTHTYMESNDTFTVTFFPDAQKDALAYLGTHSGKDEDKVSASGLSPVAVSAGVSFAEAECTLVLKKLYSADFDISKVPEFAQKRYYEAEPAHTMYVGQVLEIIQK